MGKMLIDFFVLLVCLFVHNNNMKSHKAAKGKTTLAGSEVNCNLVSKFILVGTNALFLDGILIPIPMFPVYSYNAKH